MEPSFSGLDVWASEPEGQPPCHQGQQGWLRARQPAVALPHQARHRRAWHSYIFPQLQEDQLVQEETCFFTMRRGKKMAISLPSQPPASPPPVPVLNRACPPKLAFSLFQPTTPIPRAETESEGRPPGPLQEPGPGLPLSSCPPRLRGHWPPAPCLRFLHTLCTLSAAWPVPPWPLLSLAKPHLFPQVQGICHLLREVLSDLVPLPHAPSLTLSMRQHGAVSNLPPQPSKVLTEDVI